MDDDVFFSTEQVNSRHGSAPVRIPSQQFRRVMSSVDISPNSPDSYNELLCKCYKENKKSEKSIAESEMLEELDVNNAFKMFQMANSYDCSKLLESSLILILENFKGLIYTDGFTDLCKYDLQVLLRDPRTEKTGVIVSELLHRWYVHEPDARYADFVKLKDLFLKPAAECDSISSEIEDLLPDPIKNNSLRSPVADILEKQRPKTYIAVLNGNGRSLNFSVIKASRPSQIAGWIEPPPVEVSTDNFELCVAHFCRNEYVFVRTGDRMFAYNVYKLQWKPIPALKPDVEGSGFVGSGHAVYRLGGKKIRNSEAKPTVCKYNMRNKKWKEHGKLQKPVYNSACIVYEDVIYCFGGIDSEGNSLDLVQTYYPDDKQSEVHRKLPFAVSGGQCVALNKKIFVATPDKILLEYDPVAMEVLNVCRIDVKSDYFEIVSDTQLVYIIEGTVVDCDSRMIAYHPKTGDWHCCGLLPAMNKIHGAVSFPYNPN